MATNKQTVTSCKHVLLELRLATSSLQGQIEKMDHPEYLDRLKSAKKSISEAVVQVNIVLSKASKK